MYKLKKANCNNMLRYGLLMKSIQDALKYLKKEQGMQADIPFENLCALVDTANEI